MVASRRVAPRQTNDLFPYWGWYRRIIKTSLSTKQHIPYLVMRQRESLSGGMVPVFRNFKMTPSLGSLICSFFKLSSSWTDKTEHYNSNSWRAFLLLSCNVSQSHSVAWPLGYSAKSAYALYPISQVVYDQWKEWLTFVPWNNGRNVPFPKPQHACRRHKLYKNWTTVQHPFIIEDLMLGR